MTIPEERLLQLFEEYIYSVEQAIDDEGYFVSIPHQDLHWLVAYIHRLLGDGKHVQCGHPIYRHPVGSPEGISVEDFTASIQRALDEAVRRQRT